MRRRVLCRIVPPHILRNIAERGDVEDRERAFVALEGAAHARGQREAIAHGGGMLVVPTGEKRRTIYDARHRRDLPGRLVRDEGHRRSTDDAVNEAYDGSGKTYDFFRKVLGRNSIDDRGLRLDSTVHYGNRYDNAEWDGRQMIYGDGDGKYFHRMTSAIEVIAHELTHGITQHTARLGYSRQPGALSEHFSDVFGILVKQYARRQSALRSDWLIGAELLTDRVHGVAIRSMKAPGTAYDDRVLGRDPQPSHMKQYLRTEADSGGVHVNSGIPNHAFYQVATMLGGKAWEVAGRIWYDALAHRLTPRARFQDCADATWESAGHLFGAGSAPQHAVLAAWKAVGIEVSAAIVAGGPRLRVRAVDTYEPPAPAAEVPVFFAG
jgi:Zn-dependent metalloprotease